MVISCKELLEGRNASTDESGNITLTRTMSVVTDSKADSQIVVLKGLRYPDADPDVPLGTEPILLYDKHPDAPECRIRGSNVTPTNSPTAWLVTLNYSSAPFSVSNGSTSAGAPFTNTPIDPLNPPQPSNVPGSAGGGSTSNSQPAPLRSPEVRYSTRSYTTVGEWYIDQGAELGVKKGYLNSLGEQQEGIEVTKTNLVLEIKYWSLAMTKDKIRERINRVNNANWEGFLSGSLMCQDIQVSEKYDLTGIDGDGNPVSGLILEVTVTLEENLDGWDSSTLNTSTNYKDANGKIVKATTDDGADKGLIPIKADGTKALVAADFVYNNYIDKRRFNYANLLI